MEFVAVAEAQHARIMYSHLSVMEPHVQVIYYKGKYPTQITLANHIFSLFGEDYRLLNPEIQLRKLVSLQRYVHIRQMMPLEELRLKSRISRLRNNVLIQYGKHIQLQLHLRLV